MKRPFAARVWREGTWYVSQCLEVDVASQGETEEESLANLCEALELYFEPPRATRQTPLSDCVGVKSRVRRLSRNPPLLVR
ncbi:MAG: type II toxin-antitoxin system HicB family antitoxin [Bryobacteraceae bacterium]